MRTFKLTICYDGTNYHGWQRQPHCPTIQGEVETALADLLQWPVAIAGSSRTDAGVHAFGQVASFCAETELSAEVIQRALNAKLPRDIVVRSVEEVAAGFDAIADTKRKRYRYVICDGLVKPIFQRQYCWFVRGWPLNVEAMHEAGQGIVGRFDFRSFESVGSERQSTVRTIYALEVTRCPSFGENLIYIEVEGDGFLYNMVRIIAGSLVEIGRGKRPIPWLAEVVAAQDRTLAGMTAPAQGLFLLRIDY